MSVTALTPNASLAQSLYFWTTIPAIYTDTTGTNLHSKVCLGALNWHWQWRWRCCQPPLSLRQFAASHLDYRGSAAAKTHLWSNCRDIKRAVVWTNRQRRGATKPLYPRSRLNGVEWELHLTSFFLFFTLGILPSFIFLGFCFFCCLRESLSEKKLSRGVRGTVLRSPSSSSSGTETTNIFWSGHNVVHNEVETIHSDIWH